MQCDLCGSEKELLKTIIEDSTMNVCSKCSQYGKIIQSRETAIKHFKTTITKENADRIVENYHELIKQSREKKGLKQKELANLISEKVSTIHKLETSNLKPSMRLAKKLERFLELKLIKQLDDKRIVLKKVDNSGLTIGDLLKQI